MAGRGRGLTLPAWMTSGETVGVTATEATTSSAMSAKADVAPTKPSFESSTSNAANANAASQFQSASGNGSTAHIAPPRPPTTAPPAVSTAMHSFPAPTPSPMVQPPAAMLHQQAPPAYVAPQGMYNSAPPSYPMMSAPGMPVIPSMPPQQTMLPPPGATMGMPMPPFMPPMGGMPPRFMMPPPQFPPPLMSTAAVIAAGTNNKAAVSTERAPDPINDITCWAEHKSEHGRRYWYNNVTQTSTYDKPFCLKTPEERAIPPCPWKEYFSAEGKKYYSNGTDSSWTEPEEYRIWAEKVALAEKRISVEVNNMRPPPPAGAPSASATAAAAALAAANGTASIANGGVSGAPAIAAYGGNGHNNNSAGHGNKASQAVAIPTYASAQEAMDAFKEMLARRNIASNAGFKVVQDLCRDDVVWEHALKTQGEKRQALAEYQTKRLKQEKEEAKTKQKKHRDAFLRMLAERTEIDAQTRWRQAMELLKDDARYKNIEDLHEKEDLFHEFIGELEKKEKADRAANKARLLQVVHDVLQQQVQDNVITARSLWPEHKEFLLELLKRPDFRTVLEENDLRRVFQDIVTALKEAQRAQEKQLQEDFAQKAQLLGNQLTQKVESLGQRGLIHAQSRKRDVLALLAADGDESLWQAWRELLGESSSAVLRHYLSSASNSSSSSNLSPVTSTTPVKDLLEHPVLYPVVRSAIDKILGRLQDYYREDKKTLKRLLAVVLDPAYPVQPTASQQISTTTDDAAIATAVHSAAGHIQHDSVFERIVPSFLHFARLQEATSTFSSSSSAATAAAVSEASATAAGEADSGDVAKDATDALIRRWAQKRFVLAPAPSSSTSATTTAHTAGAHKATSTATATATAAREEGELDVEEGEETVVSSSTNPTTITTVSTSSSLVQDVHGMQTDNDEDIRHDDVWLRSLHPPTWRDLVINTRQLLRTRPAHVPLVFDELLTKEREDYQAEREYRRKLEDKFLALLRDYLYRSDHLTTTWEDIKAKLQHRTAYENLTKSDRRRLFAQHMESLREKMAAKHKGLQAVQEQHNSGHALVPATGGAAPVSTASVAPPVDVAPSAGVLPRTGHTMVVDEEEGEVVEEDHHRVRDKKDGVTLVPIGPERPPVAVSASADQDRVKDVAMDVVDDAAAVKKAAVVAKEGHEEVRKTPETVKEGEEVEEDDEEDIVRGAKKTSTPSKKKRARSPSPAKEDSSRRSSRRK